MGFSKVYGVRASHARHRRPPPPPSPRHPRRHTLIADDNHRWLVPNLWGFSIASFFSNVGHEMVTSLLPGYLIAIGAPAYALGVIEGVTRALQAGANVWSGQKSDKVTNRKPYYVIGQFATAAKGLIALTSFWPLILLIRALGWVGRGIRRPMADHLLQESVEGGDVGKAYGFKDMWNWGGGIVGPLLALALIPAVGYSGGILVSVVPGVLSVLAMALLTREILNRRRFRGNGDPTVSIRSSRAFRAFLLTRVLFAIGYIAPSLLIQRSIFVMGVNASSVATSLVLFAVFNLFFSLGSYPAGALADRYRLGGQVWVLAMGNLLFAVALAGFAVGPSNPLLLGIPFVLAGFGSAVAEVTQSPIAARLLPRGSWGTALGLNAGILGGGQLLANTVTGLLVSLGLGTLAFLILSVVTFAASVVLVMTPSLRSPVAPQA